MKQIFKMTDTKKMTCDRKNTVVVEQLGNSVLRMVEAETKLVRILSTKSVVFQSVSFSGTVCAEYRFIRKKADILTGRNALKGYNPA